MLRQSLVHLLEHSSATNEISDHAFYLTFDLSAFILRLNGVCPNNCWALTCQEHLREAETCMLLFAIHVTVIKVLLQIAWILKLYFSYKATKPKKWECFTVEGWGGWGWKEQIIFLDQKHSYLPWQLCALWRNP